MNFLKNIDAYLLRHFPSVWITRVHIFLPIGLSIVLLMYLFNVMGGWNPKESLPDGEDFIIFMVIPVIIYLVYWFIFQSRYNVLKSGGKVSILQEYLNLHLYASVFFVAFLFLMVIPISNNQKISFSVGYDELKEDVNALNLGNGIIDGYDEISEESNGTYTFQESNFINFWRPFTEDAKGFEIEERQVNLSRREVLMRIENYSKAYNKYTKNEITLSPEEILSERLDGHAVYGGNYEDEYYYDSWNSSVSSKINRLYEVHVGGGWRFDSDLWFWRITIGVVFWLALIVWIFKQMNLRHFVFGLIAICLTPLVVGILGAIFFMMVRTYYSGQYALNLVLFAYAVVGGLMIRGYLSDRLNQGAYVLTMFFHFWMILLPLFIYGRIIAGRFSGYNYVAPTKIWGMEEEVFVYWVTFALGLISLVLFKPLYTKFRSLPMNK